MNRRSLLRGFTGGAILGVFGAVTAGLPSRTILQEVQSGPGMRCAGCGKDILVRDNHVEFSHTVRVRQRQLNGYTVSRQRFHERCLPAQIPAFLRR